MITNEIHETDELYFLFHANCILVKDNGGCCIYDLHRQGIYRFGTIVFEVFNNCDDKTIKKLMDTFGGNYNEGILKYINPLCGLKLGKKIIYYDNKCCAYN